MSNVEKTLEDRGKFYGDYEGGCAFRAKVMFLIQERYSDTHDMPMGLEDQVKIYDIVNKLSRLAVTPKHKDTWHDIAGYATLVEDTLE